MGAGIRFLGLDPGLCGRGILRTVAAGAAAGLEGIEFGALLGGEDLVEVTLGCGREGEGLAFEGGDRGGALIDDRVGGIRFDGGLEGFASGFDLAAGRFAGSLGGGEEGLGLLLLRVGEREVAGEKIEAAGGMVSIAMGAALGGLGENREGKGRGQKQSEGGKSGHGSILCF